MLNLHLPVGWVELKDSTVLLPLFAGFSLLHIEVKVFIFAFIQSDKRHHEIFLNTFLKILNSITTTEFNLQSDTTEFFLKLASH